MIRIFADSLTLLSIGFILGLCHAFDADHIVAVTALVSKHKSLKKASILGAFWGLGHTATLFIVGILVLGLKITIPKNIALSFEFIVGIMIVLMGISVINGIYKDKRRPHENPHDTVSGFKKYSKTDDHLHTSLILGIIHGLAGSAALMILILSTADSFFIGLVYILVFGIGSMIGMTIASTLISLPFTSRRFSLWHANIKYMTGIFSIFFGIFMMINIGLS